MAASSTARRSSSTKKAEVPAPRGQKREEQGAQSAQARGVAMPVVHAPSIRLPGGRAGTVLWWGSLAGLAAFGVVDWPVAALVAAGTWVAEQRSRQSQQPASS